MKAAGDTASLTVRFLFDGSDLPSGVYVVRATSNGLSLTQSVTILR